MLTDDEKRELIAEAKSLCSPGTYVPPKSKRLIARLADALEGTLTEPEWEYGAREDSGRVFPGSERSARGFVGGSAFPQFTEVVRRRKAGPWERWSLMTHLDVGKPLMLEDGSSFPRPPLESDDEYSPIHTVCWQGHEKITRGEAMWLVSMAEAFIYLVANPGEARKKIPMIRRALENEVPDDRD